MTHLSATTLFRVFYRSGGTLRWRWHETERMMSLDAAQTKVALLERAGYQSILAEYDQVERVGLPTEYDHEIYLTRIRETEAA